MTQKAIPFCSFGGYRTFVESWWSDLTWYIFGLSWTASYNRDEKPWWKTVRWRQPGWAYDIYTYWHRARYGWAPKDTWSLDYYLNGVLAGSLEYLADTANGAPAGYGRKDTDAPDETNFEQWDTDLRRWALAFREDPDDVKIYDTPDYIRHRAEEERRRSNLHQAIKELEQNWEALWN